MLQDNQDTKIALFHDSGDEMRMGSSREEPLLDSLIHRQAHVSGQMVGEVNSGNASSSADMRDMAAMAAYSALATLARQSLETAQAMNSQAMATQQAMHDRALTAQQSSNEKASERLQQVNAERLKMVCDLHEQQTNLRAELEKERTTRLETQFQLELERRLAETRRESDQARELWRSTGSHTIQPAPSTLLSNLRPSGPGPVNAVGATGGYSVVAPLPVRTSPSPTTQRKRGRPRKDSSAQGQGPAAAAGARKRAKSSATSTRSTVLSPYLGQEVHSTPFAQQHQLPALPALHTVNPLPWPPPLSATASSRATSFTPGASSLGTNKVDTASGLLPKARTFSSFGVEQADSGTPRSSTGLGLASQRTSVLGAGHGGGSSSGSGSGSGLHRPRGLGAGLGGGVARVGGLGAGLGGLRGGGGSVLSSVLGNDIRADAKGERCAGSLPRGGEDKGLEDDVATGRGGRLAEDAPPVAEETGRPQLGPGGEAPGGGEFEVEDLSHLEPSDEEQEDQIDSSSELRPSFSPSAFAFGTYGTSLQNVRGAEQVQSQLYDPHFHSNFAVPGHDGATSLRILSSLLVFLCAWKNERPSTSSRSSKPPRRVDQVQKPHTVLCGPTDPDNPWLVWQKQISPVVCT